MNTFTKAELMQMLIAMDVRVEQLEGWVADPMLRATDILSRNEMELDLALAARSKVQVMYEKG